MVHSAQCSAPSHRFTRQTQVMRVAAIAHLRPTVAARTPPVAILCAIGSYWIVWSVAIGLVVTASMFVRLPVSALYVTVPALFGSAAATAVALRSGGRRSLLGISVLALVYGSFLTCPGAVGTSSCDLGRIFSSHIAEIIGGAVGLPLALALRTRDGTSALLLAAAVIAISVPLLRVDFGLLAPMTGPAAYERYLWILRLEAVAAIGAGAIVAWRARHAAAALLVLAAALLLPWFSGLRLWWEATSFLRTRGIVTNLPTIIETQWQVFLPLLFVGCVLLGFGGGRIVRALARTAGSASQRRETDLLGKRVGG